MKKKDKVQEAQNKRYKDTEQYLWNISKRAFFFKEKSKLKPN